jgi:hypothetical protein
MMPSPVNEERSLFRRKARSASRAVRAGRMKKICSN